ncbi:MAG: insulinase family protein [Candidatus Eisenbacteria bacterium]|nr:insulinase family protein [Candidatus Eisenbacteria bacterium]
MSVQPGSHVSRTRPPEPLPPKPYQFPRPAVAKLANGLEVFVSTRRHLPLVSVLVGVGAGGSADPIGREGLAVMTSRLLTEGAGRRGAAKVAETVEQLGASLDASAGWELSSIRLAALSAHLGPALNLMADVTFRPRFDPVEVQRELNQRQAEILSDRDNPRSVAAERSARFVYGRHRYGAQLAGDEDSVGALGAPQLRAFHARHFRAGNAFVVLVGDVTPERGVKLVERAFGEWQDGRPRRVDVPAPRRPGPTAVRLVDQPGAAQSEIRVSQPGVARTHPEYFPLLVLNAVLGEAFGSRLYFNLREKHGYTYGVSSYFSMRRGRGPFVAGAGVHTPVTAKAVREFLREMRRIRDDAPSRQEMSDAKGFLAGGLAVELQSNGSVADRVAESVMYDLPDDYMDTYRDCIHAVTSADVVRAAKRVIDPDRMVVTVVGDAAKVRRDLERLLPTKMYTPLGRPRK